MKGVIPIEYYAHIREDDTGQEIRQTAAEHCRSAARYAASCLEPIHLHEAAYLAGLLHDAGKFKREFQDYLLRGIGSRGSVNHTFAGCRMLLEHFHNGDFETHEDATSELLSYAVGAHHGQFDCMDERGTSGFLYRMQKQNIGYEESRDNFLRDCAGWPELEDRFAKAHRELSPVYDRLMELVPEEDPDKGWEQMVFSLGQLARLLLSAVIEGDRRDTAEFMQAIPPQENSGTDSEFWNRYLHHVEKKLGEFPRNSQIQRARGQISDLCREAADRPGGIYRLHVPTGGGKTLTSLRYALAHAARWNKSRILFVTPLLSILEQNAAVIREFLGDDSIVLEHHSNVILPEEGSGELDLRELAIESWEKPVIITTLVQLLNTLFLGKTTSIRRYHALCNAVVVIDEVQTVPNHMLSLFNTALNFLSQICGTTFLLCSATQPCFEKAEHPLLLSDASELIRLPEELREPFRRTELRDAGDRKLEEIPEFLKEILAGNDSLLVICNKKNESEFLCQAMASEEIRCFHLSSAMCMAHRRDVLAEIEAALERRKSGGPKVRCVSTDVMVAGVDISFGCVVRLTAGMDSIIQSAGRCNRNGESDTPAPVYILTCSNEKLGKLREIREGKEKTQSLLYAFAKAPEAYGSDLASDAAVQSYYERLFRGQPEGYQQFIPEKNMPSLFQMLSVNDACVALSDPDLPGFTLNQAFKTAGDRFRVLDDSTRSVVVPYGEGVALISHLASRHGSFSPKELAAWVRKAKPYTVSLYQFQLDRLAGAIAEYSGILVLNPEFYDLRTGVVTKPESAFLEV